MTTADRNRIRKLQDEILAEAERLELPWHIALSVDMPSRITLESIRHFLEPDYEPQMKSLLDDLKSR